MSSKNSSCARGVTEVGLSFPTGIAGSRLNGLQRQKLAIARGILKEPRRLIVDEATAALDESTQNRIMENLLSVTGGGLIWVFHRANLCKEFDQTLVLESGKVTYLGPFRDEDQPQWCWLVAVDERTE
jgi:ABC-type bacteriocin/lantibiotic exporter with double-glycine peptidase domain